MAPTSKKPRRLYKYRAFSNRSLDTLVRDRLYFSKPCDFNDPLDTKPSLKADLKTAELEQVLAHFLIQRLDRYRVEEEIEELRYNAENPELAYRYPLRYLLGREIKSELLRQYDNGAVCLSERADCPLMWSHYGDQHKGFCAGYSIPADAAATLHRIRYGSSRLVSARDVKEMLAGDHIGRKRVDDAVLLSKASDWQYEREWRLIGKPGSQRSTLELTEVIFGLRCETAVEYSVIKALKDRSRPPLFYKMHDKDGTFELSLKRYDYRELMVKYPLRSRDARGLFKPIKRKARKNAK